MKKVRVMQPAGELADGTVVVYDGAEMEVMQHETSDTTILISQRTRYGVLRVHRDTEVTLLTYSVM